MEQTEGFIENKTLIFLWSEKQTQNKLDFERKKCKSKRKAQDSVVRIQGGAHCREAEGQCSSTRDSIGESKNTFQLVLLITTLDSRLLDSEN
jgi:hypothetical protein